MHRSRSVRSRSVACVALAVAVLLSVDVATAAAHAAFSDAVPEPGARIQRSPARITLAFTEPLNHGLTRASLIDARTRRRVPGRLSFGSGNRLIVTPLRPLPTAAYTVRWHTVSILDGHALEGSFGFGVRTAAIGGAQRLEQSPLARGGWLRVAMRTLFYSCLFFFGGGLFTALLLSRGHPARWLVPGPARDSPARSELDAGARRDRAWRRTRVAGWLAAAAGTGVALVETADAAGSLSARSVDRYLLSTQSGAARVVAVAAVVLAVLVAARAWRLAAAAAAVALLAVAVGGHANSASSRALAVSTDWLHLLAASVWAGGIAQIGTTWLPTVGQLSVGERRAVMRGVLQPFGSVALPAFAVVVVSGVANALIELGRVQALWQTAYGRVLGVKMALVGAIALASYVHALRLRPGLLAGERAARERRHWRLLGSEPALGALVLGVAALLAVFPLPPRQLLERAEAGGEPAVGTPAASALRAPRGRELAVAEEAGQNMVGVLVRHDGRGLSGTVRVLGLDVRPVRAAVAVSGATNHACGAGCVAFTTAARPPTLHITVATRRARWSTAMPVRWQPDGSATARSILRRAVARMDALRTLRIHERLSGGSGTLAISDYRLQAPDRSAIVTRDPGRSDSVTIGRRYWSRVGRGHWQAEPGQDPLSIRLIPPWRTHLHGVRLLGVLHDHGRRLAAIALAEPAKNPPFWFRLRIDLATMRVVSMRMIAPGHFMRQRYFAFNTPLTVRPPRQARHTR